MGQKVGKPGFQKGVEPFINLPKSLVHNLWTTFNLTAEGWSLSQVSFRTFCNNISEEYELTNEEFIKYSDDFFRIMDTDENDIIDALELLGTLSVISGMEKKEILPFIFNCYDFDESNMISFDEMTLALKSISSGLSKLISSIPPSLNEIETLTSKAFLNFNRSESERLDINEFLTYCQSHPIIQSWLDFFDDIDENMMQDFLLSLEKEKSTRKPENDENLEKKTENNIDNNDVDDNNDNNNNTTTNNNNNNNNNNDDDDDSDFERELNKYNKDRKNVLPSLDDEEEIISDPMNIFMVEEEEDGDEFMAVKPWIGTINSLEPEELPPLKKSAPDSNLSLEWVHGYRSQDTRNNLRYTNNGDIVYFAAALGIVYRKPNEEREFAKQDFFKDHTDDITSIAISPDGNIVATGEMGKRPKIIIWDVNTLECIKVFRGFHKRAIQFLDFSPDGKLLLSMGQDNDNSIAIYDINTGSKKLTASTNKGKILDCRWSNTNEMFVTCGVKSILMWTREGNTWKSKKGLFGRKGTIQPLLTIASCPSPKVPTRIATGTKDGSIYLWEGRNCKASYKAHKGCVNTLFYHSDTNQLISGGNDGNIKIWDISTDSNKSSDKSLTLQNVIDVNESTDTIKQKIRSVCLNKSGTNLLIGTNKSEIYEIAARTTYNEETEETFEIGTNINGRALISGHYKGELWGLTTHPHDSEYLTVGDDNTVRVWDSLSKRCLRQTIINTRARSVAYSADGTLIAVGLGGGIGHNSHPKDGNIIILNNLDLSIVTELNDSNEWISDIKFSPNGRLLAAGSHDNSIYIYDTANWELQNVCDKHNSYITHLDFSMDSSYIRSTCGAYELLFFDSSIGEQETRSSDFKDIEWATNTCTLGWAIQGIWPSHADGTDINAISVAGETGILASADDFGKVNLLHYPCYEPDAKYNTFYGHSSHVTNISFISGSSHCISVGGNDRCIFQWLFNYDEAEDSVEESDDDENNDINNEIDENDSLNDEDSDEENQYKPHNLSSGDDEDYKDGEILEPSERHDIFMSDDMTNLFSLEEETTGDEFMAIKPWKGAISEPSNYDPNNIKNEIVDDDLELEWIHGYSSQNLRSSLFYNNEGDIIYSAAATGVIFNKTQWKQKFNNEHTDDIYSLAIHPDGIHIATGQIGKRPTISIWNSNTGKTVKTFRCGKIRAVSELQFSENGKYLVSIGSDDNHTIQIYDWENGIRKSKMTSGKDKVLTLCFGNNDTQLLQAGVKHFKLWTSEGKTMSEKKGLFGSRAKRQAILSSIYFNDSFILGTKDGNLYRIDDRKVSDIIDAHERQINSIYKYSSIDGEGIITGSRDGWIKLWDEDLTLINEFDLRLLNPLTPHIRSVCMSNDTRKILVGTYGSEIYELSSLDGTNINDGPLIQGHCKDELWGLAIHPIKDEYATVGDDKTLRIWDTTTYKQKSLLRLDDMARAVAYAPNGHLIAIGMGGSVERGRRRKDGAVIVVSALQGELRIVHETQDAREWISDIKFSPDGNILAAGSHDNCIYLYNTLNNFELIAVCDKHNSYITHFDFSENSKWIQSNCGAYELLFFDAQDGDQNPHSSDLKDVEWHTWTCTLGFPVQGIWEGNMDGTDINAVDRSHNKDLLALVDDFGKVKLLPYPCVKSNTPYKDYIGHSSHVTNCRWTNNDDHLITTGGNDECIFQWLHIRPDEDELIESKEANNIEINDELFNDENLNFNFNMEFNIEETDDGDQFSSIKPWVGSIVAPDVIPSINSSKPDINLNLEFVHGYEGGKGRSNVVYNNNDDIIFSAAALGVIYNKSSHSQTFYNGNDDDIISLAISPNGQFVATGQHGRRPLLRIWNSNTGTELCTLPAYHRRAISQISFSKDNKSIVSLGQDDNHSMAVWISPSGDWYDGKKLVTSKNIRSKVFFSIFTGWDDYEIVTGGEKHVKFWSIKGGNIRSKKGVFGKLGTIQPIFSAISFNNNIITGSLNGELYVWDDSRRVIQSESAHNGAIYSLSLSPSNNIFVSGGSDGLIKLWDINLDNIMTFNIMETNNPPLLNIIRSVCINKNETKILIGTKSNEIIELSIDTSVSCKLLQGHYSGELWGVCSHVTNPDLYATCGDDGTIRIWSVREKSVIKQCSIEGKARCISWSGDGNTIAVGLEGGSKPLFAVIDTLTMNISYQGGNSNESASDIKFSPDGSILAVSSRDNAIYLYNINRGYQEQAKCNKHSSYITHFDFTLDGQYIRSTCGAYELLFFRVSDGSHVPDGATTLANTIWATETCPLGWGVQGIWPENSDGTDINAVAKTKETNLLGTVDDSGLVKLFNYPCIEENSESINGKGHASHVTNLCFTSNDQTLITVGGNDHCVFQWQIS